MIKSLITYGYDEFHKIYNIFGIKFKFKEKNNLIKKSGHNNHVYVLCEDGFQKEIFYSPFGLKISICGNNNKIVLKKPFGRYQSSNIKISKTNDSYTEIGSNTALLGTLISIHNGQNQNCIIGNSCSTSSNCVINIHNNTSFRMGKGCMLAQNITIYTSDGHAIIDTNTNKCINADVGSVDIGDYCWLGFGSILLKGAKLGNKCILGAGSVLTKDFSIISEGIICGNPAKLIKNGTSWARMTPSEYVEKQKDNLIQS